MTEITVSLACDHRGFELKSLLSARLGQRAHIKIVDLGTDSASTCDASDFAQKLADDLRRNPAHKGILICGSGQAMAITANRYKHIRAALCLNTTMARLAREHNDANVLVLGAHIMGFEVAMDCVETFLTTAFGEGRFTARRDKLTSLGGL